ncbi:hypothetical protein [Streptomyces sp. C8S0]|uniref:hypothetical protein n=1 Tax=Streptomyces sp. C8S0 TaxID=2585716 RepID=UPI001D043C42|nr:hypothetical protein [Streptomyces sp. C8S0]
MAATVLAAGGLGDAFGLRRLMMLGLATVTVADLLSVFSPATASCWPCGSSAASG